MAKSDLFVLIGAILGTAAMFLEIRTPGSVGMRPLLFLLTTIAVLVLRVLVSAFVRRKWRWSTAVLLAMCLVGPIAARSWGFRARDLRFSTWRLPVYEGIVSRINGTPTSGSIGEGRTTVDLIGRESEVAIRVDVWKFESGERLIRFWWASTGPPPKHWYYDYRPTLGSNDANNSSDGLRRVGEGWYESHD